MEYCVAPSPLPIAFFPAAEEAPLQTIISTRRGNNCPDYHLHPQRSWLVWFVFLVVFPASIPPSPTKMVLIFC